MAEDVQRLFSGVRDFGWNPEKREHNLRKHKIDFEDARGILNGPTFIRRSDRHGEVRYQIFGYVQGRQVSVACALRGSSAGSSRPGDRGGMSEENITIVSRDSPRKGKTDWARFDAIDR